MSIQDKLQFRLFQGALGKTSRPFPCLQGHGRLFATGRLPHHDKWDYGNS
jgi:hypothetical protein